MSTTAPTDEQQLDFRTATVADAMTVGLISCTPDTPLRNVAALMAIYRVHGVYVFDYGDEDDETAALWGLVSDLDVVAAACGDMDARTAGDSAIEPLVTVMADERLDRAAQLMAESNVSHLAVIEPTTQRPTGVISTLDLLRVLAPASRRI
jgi:CBS domain-containing protein